MLLTIDDIAKYTKACIINDFTDMERQVHGVTWDSREVVPGCLYVALPGTRVDGHSFVESACEAGALAVLIMQDISDEAFACACDHDVAVLRVRSTHDAFTDLARGYRSHLKGKVIGITGSTGKTTTKNLVRDVLGAQFSCVATRANQNNELGVPRTILNADPDTEMVVVEMGMRGMGQISHLCEFVRPDWGLITNVGESHIELLGSRENIARAKSELICALPEDKGRAFLNAADDMTDLVWRQLGDKADGIEKVLFDGSGTIHTDTSWPSVWAENISLDEQGYPSFTLCACGIGSASAVRASCSLSLRGAHNVSNAVSAAAVGLMAGIKIDRIVTALEAAEAESGRQEFLVSDRGFTVINDAYNANPDSMRASLSLLNSMEVEGRRIAVLGDMGELGSFAQAAHESVGAYVAHCGIDLLVCVGELACLIGQGALSEGFAKDHLRIVSTCAEASELLRELVLPGDVVLVKASHFMELDILAKGLLD